MKYRIKNTQTTIMILAIYQIVGGIVGFGLVTWLLLRTQTVNGVIFLIFITAIGLYGFSIKSGSVLIRKDYKRGLIFSMINQIIQIVAIGLGSHKYDFFSGIKAAVGFDMTNGFNFSFDIGLYSEIDFAINVSDKEYFLYINLMAIFLVCVFRDIYKEIILSDLPINKHDRPTKK